MPSICTRRPLCWGYGRRIRNIYAASAGGGLAQETRTSYRQKARTYRQWLGGTAPSQELAADFIGDLRERGFEESTIRVYTVVVREIHRLLSQNVNIKANKPRSLPRYTSESNFERLLSQALRGLRAQTPAMRERNNALIAV